MWTDRVRPAAVLSTYEYTDVEGIVPEQHEFCSLALEGLHFASPKPIVWAPSQPGVELELLTGAPTPASSPRQRLSQMRELAAKFAAEKTTRQNETRELRLLPQPGYRYDAENGGGSQFVDGALFAFVEATDPEVFLVVEARLRDGKPFWHYAAARMNSVRLQVSQEDVRVWEAGVLAWKDAPNRRDLSYTAFQVR